MKILVSRVRSWTSSKLRILRIKSWRVPDRASCWAFTGNAELRPGLSQHLYPDPSWRSAALKLAARGFGTELGFTALEWNDLPSPTFEADDNKTLYIPLAAWNMPVRLSIVPGIQGEILTWIHHKDSALSPSSKRLVPGLEVSFFYGQHVLCSPNYEIRKGLPKVIIQDL